MATPRKQSTAKPTGVLLRKDIQTLGIICENSSEECFKPASYDLRIGDLYISTDGKQQFAREPLQGCGVEVPPLGSLIVSTHEILKMPGNVVGNFDLRIKLAVKGLFVQMGTQVEPYYQGRLFAILHNVTASPVKLKWGGDDAERLFTIEFMYTNGIADNPAEPKIYNSLTQFMENMPFAENQIGGLLHLIEEAKADFKSVSEKVDDAQNSLKSSLENAINNKFGTMQAHLDAQSAVDEAMSKLRNDERAFKRQLIAGGLGIAAFSVIIPFLIGFAINFARPIAFTDFDEGMGKQLSDLQADIQSIKDSANESNRLDTVVTRIEDISERLTDLQRQIEIFSQKPYSNDNKPGSNPETEQ